MYSDYAFLVRFTRLKYCAEYGIPDILPAGQRLHPMLIVVGCPNTAIGDIPLFE